MSHERLLSVLRYEPETGKFFWLIVPRIGVKIGQEAGTKRRDGYVVIKVDGVRYLAHRLAIFYVTGEWPPQFVDHENRQPGDDREANVRPATPAQNVLNSKRRERDLPRGVSRHHNKFQATTTERSAGKLRNVFIGSFDTPEAAHQAWRDHMAAKHGADFLPTEANE